MVDKRNVSVVLFLVSVFLITGCEKIPTISTQPQPPSNPTSGQADQSQSTDSEYLDDLGCFPVGCDLPPGMKELCQAYEAGSINWPSSCTEMPGEACQTLCEREKANAPTALPTTTIDAYEVGWMEPVQLDDNIEDSLRPALGWILPTILIDNEDHVMFWYSLDLGQGGYTPTYYRYWDGDGLTEPREWNALQGLYRFDSANNLHIIVNKDYGEENATLVHIIWDGVNFTQTTLFPDRLVQPCVLSNNLDIDEDDNLHLTFQDKSKGVMEVWYTRYDGLEWSEPINLSQSSGNSRSPSLAVGKDGMVFLAWHEESDDTFVTGQTAPVMFTMYDGETWSEPVDIPFTATFVDVQADKRGFAYIHAENKFVIWDGSKWEGPYEVEYPGWPTAMYHRFTEDSGQIHFIWNRYHEVQDQGTGEVRYQRDVCYRKRAPDGTWSPVMSLGIWSEDPTYAEYHSSIEVDSSGVVHASFGAKVGGMLQQYYTNSGAEIRQPELLTQEIYQTRLIERTGGKLPPTDFPTLPNDDWTVEVLPLEESEEPRMQIAVDSNGILHMVWQGKEGDHFGVFYSSYDGVKWNESMDVSHFEGYDTHPVITVDSDDRVHVTWIRWAEGTSSVYWSYLDDGSWSEPQKLSERVTWELLVAMIPLVADVENALRPSIANGPDGTLAMSWSHSPEGFTTSVSTIAFDGQRWAAEEFPGGDDSWVYAADWSSVDMDSNGYRHLIFVASGMMDPDSYLFAQPFHMVETDSGWSEAELLLSIPEDSTPGSQMVFRPVIETMDLDRIFVAFSMRPFERENTPYRLDTENSNTYLIFGDGSGWSDPRRLDPGDAFGPSYVDMALDKDGVAHIVWAKYDTYNKRYSLFYTTSDGVEESNIVLLWQADDEQEPYPIIKPDIDVGEDGSVHVLMAVEETGMWRTVYFSKP
jgi:hypothetical protein